MAFEDVYGDMPLEDRKVLRADQLMKLEFSKDWLIDGLLHNGDCWFLKAQSKVGKSLFCQAVAHACSIGGMLFDEYRIAKPMKVAYIFSESNFMEWKSRMKKMSGIHPYNAENIWWINAGALNVKNPKDAKKLKELIKSVGVDFEILFWDCFYKFITGSKLSDEDAVGAFNGLEEEIRNHYGAASVIIHHDSEKIHRDMAGGVHSSASSSRALGSTLILAHPTHYHTIYKMKDPNNGKPYLFLKKGDCRSGDIVGEITVFLVGGDEEDSIGFTIDEESTNGGYLKLRTYIKNEGSVHVKGLREAVGLTNGTFNRHRNRLISEGAIEKVTVGSGSFYEWKGCN